MTGVHEVSDGDKDSIWSWTRSHACYILSKNLSTFCPCPKTFWEAEFKGDGLINLAEEVLGSSAFGLWHRYCWQFLTRFIVRIALGTKQQI
jgi:hypothetical protein